MILSFREAAFGVKKTVSVLKNEKCSDCSGTGAKSGTHPETCSNCQGTGEVRQVQRTPFGSFQSSAACTKCGGTGKVIKEPCRKCSGSGVERKTKNIEVNIPKGIDDGQTLTVRGEGEPGKNGGPYGDLYLNIRITKDKLFTRKEFDVYVDLPLTFVEASLGAKIIVPTLDEKIELTIPEGTQFGAKFVLKGKGIPHLRGNGRGNQYVIAKIEVPKKLSSKQKDLLKQFEKASDNANYTSKKSFIDNIKELFS